MCESLPNTVLYVGASDVQQLSCKSAYFRSFAGASLVHSYPR